MKADDFCISEKYRISLLFFFSFSGVSIYLIKFLYCYFNPIKAIFHPKYESLFTFIDFYFLLSMSLFAMFLLIGDLFLKKDNK